MVGDLVSLTHILIAQSTVDAELIALSSSTQEYVYLSN